MPVQLFTSCLVSATLSARMHQNAKVKKMEARLPPEGYKMGCAFRFGSPPRAWLVPG